MYVDYLVLHWIFFMYLFYFLCFLFEVFSDYIMLLILQIFDIIGFVYQYLKLLREVSPQEWIFKELQDIGNMEFRFAEEQPQDDYAAELAGVALLICHLHLVLFGVLNLRSKVLIVWLYDWYTLDKRQISWI